MDEATRAWKYEIQFTEEQVYILEELCEILDENDDDQDHRANEPEEDNNYNDVDLDLDENQEEDQEEDDDFKTEGHRANETDDEFLTWLAEKLMQLSIAFITHYFPSGDNLHSPLIHFANVMGISNQFHRFQELYNCTWYVAALLWMCRLLVMEYALPTRAYTILDWSTGKTYQDKGGRFRFLHRSY